MSDPHDPGEPDESGDPGHERGEPDGDEPDGDEPDGDEPQEPALDDPAALGLGERDPDGLDVTAAELEALGLDPGALEDGALEDGTLEDDAAEDAPAAGAAAGTPPAGAGPTAVGALDALLARPAGPRDRTRLRTLLELLGRPDQAQPAIVVTASHGASSIGRLTAAFLGALGLTAGTYEVSHLQDVGERCRIATEIPDRPTLEALAAELAPYLTEADARFAEPVTRDEALEALAVSRFADAPVDVVVVEAGAEGVDGLASLVRAEVVVVGATEPEEAAIPAALAAGAPVVVEADQPDAVAAQVAGALGEAARRIVLGRDASVARRDHAVAGQDLDLHGVTGEFDDVYLALQGPHQADNALAALAAVEGLLGFAGGIDPDVVREAAAAVRAPGRLEVVRRPDAPTVVLDLADRPARTAALARALDEEFAFDSRAVVAAPATGADVALTLRPLVGPGARVVAAAAEGSADPERVAAAAQALGAQAVTADDVGTAIETASPAGADPAGRDQGAVAVVVCGTPGLVGAARAALGLAPA